MSKQNSIFALKQLFDPSQDVELEKKIDELNNLLIQWITHSIGEGYKIIKIDYQKNKNVIYLDMKNGDGRVKKLSLLTK